MIAYTGIETVSNLAEEARDPRRSIPGSIRLVAIAVFAIYFTLPLVALSALPVHQDAAGDYVTRLGLDPPAGLQERPGARPRREPRPARRRARRREDLRRRPRRDDPLHRHERRRDRRLADHVLDGELPAAAGAVPAPASALQDARARAGRLRRRLLDPLHAAGQRRLHRPHVRVRRDALVHDRARLGRSQMRRKPPPVEEPYRVARRTCAVRGVDWPLFAIFGGLGTAVAWLVVVVQDAPTRYAGLGWLALGFVVYAVYRRRLGVPLRATVRAPIAARPGDRARVPDDPRPDRRRAASRARRSTSPRGSRPSAARRSSRSA